MITIWGRTNSPNVAKVLWALDELGLGYDRIDAGGSFGITDDAGYRAMNPNGRVPTCKDGDVVVWESNAIVRYLAARYGDGHLWYEDPGRRSLDDRWMDWASLTFYQPVLALHRATRIEHDAEKREAIAKAKAALDEPVGVLSTALDGKQYIAGATFGLGDIALGLHVHRLMNASHAVPLDEAIARYHDRLVQRPPFMRHAAGIL